MNCQDFETSVMDLARDQMMEAAARERALAHAQACAQCALRLADERALTAGLRTLAASEAAQETPARVEAALLTAFRQRAIIPVAPAVISPVTSAHRWRRWSLVAAAAALVLLALLAPRWWRTPSQEAKLKDLVRPALPASTPMPDEHAPPPLPSPITPQLVMAPRSLHQHVHTRRSGPTAQRGNSNVDLRQSATESEIVTDFLPLTYGDNLPPLDSGRVVRVKMPRSALVSFGLPMNLERASEPIKADVLLGEDGLARAIRFVR